MIKREVIYTTPDNKQHKTADKAIKHNIDVFCETLHKNLNDHEVGTYTKLQKLILKKFVTQRDVNIFIETLSQFYTNLDQLLEEREED